MKYLLAILSCFVIQISSAQKENYYKTQGYTSLFNGKDLERWVVPKDNNKSWSAFNGTIDCALTSKAPKGKRHLYTKNEYKDFSLHIEWRFKGCGDMLYKMPTILPNGDYLLDKNGEKVTKLKPNADSGIFIKKNGQQVNLWCWDVGSGELWSVRNNKKLPENVRSAAVPSSNQDNPIGQWNAMDIHVKGDRITVISNGIVVINNALFPGIDVKGPIGLQHHGYKNEKTGKLGGTASLVQFKNIWIKEL